MVDHLSKEQRAFALMLAGLLTIMVSCVGVLVALLIGARMPLPTWFGIIACAGPIMLLTGEVWLMFGRKP